VRVAKYLALALLIPVVALASEIPGGGLVRLSDVTVSADTNRTTVRIATSGTARYHAALIDSPNRLVVDFDDTTYGWRKIPLSVTTDPIRQIRGSQYRKTVARVVIELTRRVSYVIRDDAQGVDVLIGGAELASESVSEPDAVAESQPTPSDATATTPPPSEPIRVAASAPASAPQPAPPQGLIQAQVQTPPSPAPAPPVTTPSAPPAAAPSAPAAPSRPATAPAPGAQRLISLEFKEADVVNLLRILAAESGKNIVIGDDVKGKMSISLRNVPWEQALAIILEARSLEQVERDGVLRIVSTDQLAKEREAKARVEEAKLKAEADTRTKIAEAQVKEAEALTKKIAAEAAAREAEARGPLKEETIRLRYADPEEVAKTLQGILGIPAEGKQIQGPGVLGSPVAGPIAEPPFSQLYGPPPPPGQPAPVISVSQDVLAKGLTIRAHKPTNSLFLRLYSADLDRVKKLIEESLDIPLPQVKIEARMEILDRTALEAIGIQWGGMLAQNIGSQAFVGQGLQTAVQQGQTVPVLPGWLQGTTAIIDPITVAPAGLQGSTTLTRLHPANIALHLLNTTGPPREIGGLPVSFQTGLPLGANLINLPINTLPNAAGVLPAGGFNFGLIGKLFNINLALQALATQGKTRTLARPEIITVENNKATMSLGEEIPYATVSSAGTQIQFKEALLKLEVTPTVIKEGDTTRIKLVVVVENNSRGDIVQLGGSGSPPAINKRRAETIVLVREGDRLVIGGVANNRRQYTRRKVPIFGDIPVLGWLFKQKEDFEQDRELVVFVTPTVLRHLAAGAPPSTIGPAFTHGTMSSTPPAK